MPRFEVSWQAFGTVEVEAEDIEQAVDYAYSDIAFDLFGVDYSGLDVGDSVEQIGGYAGSGDEDDEDYYAEQADGEAEVREIANGNA